MLVIFGDGSVFSELMMERSQRESQRNVQPAHMFRMGWEAASGSDFPITACKKEGWGGRRSLLFICGAGRKRERNEEWKMREKQEESAFFLLLGGLLLDRAVGEENAMFGFKNA